VIVAVRYAWVPRWMEILGRDVRPELALLG